MINRCNARVVVTPLFLLVCLINALFAPLLTLAVVLALLSHELGHVAAAHVAGVRLQEIRFFVLGGESRFGPGVRSSPAIEALVAVSGPAVNLLIGILIYIMKGNPEPEGFFFFWQSQIALGLFNLLPALPLDGGILLLSALSPRLGLKKSAGAGLGMGMVLSAGIFLIGLLLITADWKALNLILLAGFLAVRAREEKRQIPFRLTRHLLNQRILPEGEKVIRCLPLVAGPDAAVSGVLGHSRPGWFIILTVLDNEREPVVLDEKTLIDAAFELGFDAPLRQVLDWRQKH